MLTAWLCVSASVFCHVIEKERGVQALLVFE
jgi:hypothetical protein